MPVRWKTHPWLNFELDLRKITPDIWIKLGEARSKCEHLAGVALGPEASKQLHSVFLAKGVHATAAIEGNTLSEEQVLSIVKETDDIPVTQAYQKTEVQNILAGANEILDNVEKVGPQHISVRDIKSYNRTVLKELEVEDHVQPGEISKKQVGVLGYRGLAIEHCEAALQELVMWLNNEFKSKPEHQSIYGLIKAIVGHVYLVWIHPFGDGNGRTARLMEVRFLLEAGLPSTAAHLLSNHYNNTRAEYYRQLDRASKNGGDLTAFLNYAISGFVEEMRQQIKVVKAHQWEVVWVNHIHDYFANMTSPTSKRQRKLALAISRVPTVERKDVRRVSPEVAEQYAMNASKTVSRDLNALVDANLIERQGTTYRARKEIVLQFLPRSRPSDREAQIADVNGVSNEPDSQLELGLDH